MKKLSVLICVLFSAIALNAQSSIDGIWNTGKENTKLEIAAVDGIYQGKIVSSDNAKAKIGAQLIKDVQLVDGQWRGKLFAAKKKKWMDAVLAEKDNQLLITVKAGLISRTIKWAKG
ncbi:MAG: hypothetical protein HRU41_12090 [Saprospiraceae bacterium]|nr:hypothetical protein [Saprospiraceae bacterium]